jgi:acyl CoA:acetate/3-ketoacid CoA transferase
MFQYDSTTSLIIYAFFFFLLCVIYFLLFPSRVGDTSRISFIDRILLAFRLLFARISLAFFPVKEVPLKTIFSGKSVPSPPPPIFFDSSVEAIKKVFFSSLQDGKNYGKQEEQDHVFYFSGFAATESPFVWFKALSEFTGNEEPTSSNLPPPLLKNVTIMSQTGSSLRGVGSVALDNLIADSKPGTIKRIISGHLETLHKTFRRAQREQKEFYSSSSTTENKHFLEIYNIPLGVVSRLVGLQNEIDDNNNNSSSTDSSFGPSLKTTVGLGTYFESENSCKITPYSCKWNLVSLEKQDVGADSHENNLRLLSYKIPKITSAFIHAKVADRKGNVYFHQNTLIADSYDSAMAAKRNRGKVFVSVEHVLSQEEEEEELEILLQTPNNNNNATPLMLKRDFIDAIVVVNSVLQKDFSGLSKFCSCPSSSSSSSSRFSVCEKWEQASLAWGFATTFHSRWRNTNRHSALVTHCHDEVLRLAKMFMIQEAYLKAQKNKINNDKKQRESSSTKGEKNEEEQKEAGVVRILIGVSLPELVAMRLVESGNVFVENSSSSTTFTLDGNSKENQRLDLRRENDSNLENFKTFTNQTTKISAQVGTPVIQLAIESGVVGGLPAPGFLFGNAFKPYKILRSPVFWNLVNGDGNKNNNSFAHMCILGAGEVDVFGNVNVSDANPIMSTSGGDEKQKQQMKNLEKIIGCGGFCDICEGASFAVVFVVSISSAGTRFTRTEKKSSIVQNVSQISFSPLRALTGEKNRDGRKCLVRYCTEFGIFSAETWNDFDDKEQPGKLKTKLVAPIGLELLIQQKCGVKLIL